MLNLLECPKCKNQELNTRLEVDCPQCGTNFPVIRSIPRFVPEENYASSFGFQWNIFENTQIDSKIRTNRSEKRFINETLWDSNVLKGKLVLDAGCGAGRFSEIALKFGAKLVAADLSSAVDTAQVNLESSSRLILQADLANLPIKSDTFDYVYCIGVLQHTKNPEAIVRELIRCLKVNGELALSFYENSSWHVKFYSKYLIRPITKRIPPKMLLDFLTRTSVFWFPTTTWLFRLPAPLPRIFRFVIPIANYVEFEYLSKEDALNESILDTFDMLSPQFDRPIKKSTIMRWMKNSNFEMIQLSHNPKFGTMRFKKSNS